MAYRRIIRAWCKGDLDPEQWVRLADVECPLSSKQVQDVPVSPLLCPGTHIRQLGYYALIAAVVTFSVISVEVPGSIDATLPAGRWPTDQLTCPFNRQILP